MPGNGKEFTILFAQTDEEFEAIDEAFDFLLDTDLHLVRTPEIYFSRLLNLLSDDKKSPVLARL